MKQAAQQIHYIPIQQIKPYPNNPRDNSQAIQAVIKSIKAFGIINPAVIDRDNIIIVGHTRIEAAKQLAFTEYPCIYADQLTPDEIRAFRLADNRIREETLWQPQQLAQEMHEIKTLGFDMLNAGLSEFDLIKSENIYQDFIANAPQEIDASPPQPEQPQQQEQDQQDQQPQHQKQPDNFLVILTIDTAQQAQYFKDLICEPDQIKTKYSVQHIRRLIQQKQEA